MLRDHEDAQPEIRELARMMKKAMNEKKSAYHWWNEWHLPFVTADERMSYPNDTLIKLSAARCARVSYLTHEGNTPSVEADIALYDRLVGSIPLHASPVEHQAMPAFGDFANFNGWKSHRFQLEIQ